MSRRRNKKGYALPGSKRAARLAAEAALNKAGPTLRPVTWRGRLYPVGLKQWTVLTLSGYEVRTPWAAKERKRRRAANKVAKLSRRGNRG